MNPNLLKNIRLLVELEKNKNRPFKPVIVSDIDGVLVRGGTPIPGTLEAMRKIHERKIPFACLTNGGGQLETMKANKLNSIFGQNLFQGPSMFMNHTPLKPKLIEFSQKEGNLLISNSCNVKDILTDLKINNFITTDEIWAIYIGSEQSSVEFESDLILHEREISYKKSKEEVERRLGRKIGSFSEEADNINSIFALNDVSPYQITLEVVHNVLEAKSALGKEIQYFAAQNDIVWASGYDKPRMAFGPFNYILESHCRKYRFKLMEHVYYGKPQKKAFKFVQAEMLKRQPEGVLFMVGDNPRADIRGANGVGWYSFLTKTGIHQSAGNDKNDPATFVVENFSEVVEIILGAESELK